MMFFGTKARVEDRKGSRRKLCFFSASESPFGTSSRPLTPPLHSRVSKIVVVPDHHHVLLGRFRWDRPNHDFQA